jgi:hypothetical protein
MRHLIPACALLALGLTGCSVRDAGSDPVTITADVPATGLQNLKFESTAGQVRISVSPDDAIHIKLKLQLEERKMLGVSLPSEDTLKDAVGAKVGQKRDGDALVVSAAFPSGGDHNSDVKQEWEVQVPARFGVDASMKEGRMVISGVSGGVKSQLSAGETVIHVTSGPVYARIGAGRLHVISDASQPGMLSIASTFGLAILDLQGTYYGPPEQHGGLHLFGNSVHQRADGKDDFDLKVTAGLADLRIGPQGDEKEYRDLFAEDREHKSDKKDAKDAAKKSDKDDDQDDDE